MRLAEAALNGADWELIWATHDERTYQDALDFIQKDDVVLDIGAGDLRLARRIAAICRRVFAVEIQEVVLNQRHPRDPLPENLTVFHADACTIPFPDGLTAGVLLMRHCRHFRLYAEKLKAAGARRLITNARWGLGVEVIELLAGRTPYPELAIGWYACWCGASGFKPGPAAWLTPEIESITHEVSGCPACSYSAINQNVLAGKIGDQVERIK